MEPKSSFVAKVGRQGLRFLEYLGGMSILLKETLYWTFIAPLRKSKFRWASLFKQMVRVGVNSIPIVGLVLIFIGMVIALQMAYVLKMFGAKTFVATAVSVAMVRELGPLLTAVVMSGFAGASITAELGTMQVSEEIIALRATALDPVRFLVVPRFWAIVIMVPCLTFIGDFIGILGGYIISVGALQIGHNEYWSNAITYLVNKDFFTGFIKSLVFAALIALIACYEGFRVRGGAEGVGKNTTASVVLSIITIIAADVLLTALFYFIWT